MHRVIGLPWALQDGLVPAGPAAEIYNRLSEATSGRVVFGRSSPASS
jgi:hypothetical protein